MKMIQRKSFRNLFMFVLCLLIALSVTLCYPKEYFADSSGISLLPDDALTKMNLIGPSYASMQMVPVEGQPFSQAIRARTSVDPQGSHLAQLRINIAPAVAKDDVLFASFYVRAIELPSGSDVARTEVAFENKVSYEKSTTTGVYIGTDWKKVEIPFVSYMDHPEGGSQMLLRIGFPPQVIEIGGLQLINYQKTLQVSDLPKTGIGYEGYEGREENAQWRQDALQRIEQIRKADLTVQVQDKDGQNVQNASVEVKMLNHEFMWGTAVTATRLLGTNADSDKYRQAVTELFNSAVPENELKMTTWDTANRSNGSKVVNWLNERGLRVRGHTLVWQKETLMPVTANELKYYPVLYRNRVRDYVNEEADFFKGQFVDWDVVNEPKDNHLLTDSFGMSESAQWYNQVRQIEGSSGANMYLNETGVEGGNPDNINRFIKVLDDMQNHGVSIDGIGLQSHFGQYPGSMNRYLSMFDKYATYADNLEITEFDHATADENLQADFMRDYMTAAFSHPAMKGFLIWGFWDSANWRSNAPIYRKDWSLKPSGQVWKDLVFDQWWTNEAGSTDAQGKFSIRGFLGDYEVKVNYQGHSQTFKTKLGSGGTQEIVIIDSELSGDSTLQQLAVGGVRFKGFPLTRINTLFKYLACPMAKRQYRVLRREQPTNRLH
ncbi:endo-1,4-beta-xylanase [Paenibacillus sp. RC67]|uniref:endo-1,4-beta-xylanase n=1 Tax=Paenibacillus sp. RC67 TaxID=3039392 RepID=UPI0024AD8B3F|nr:endo-1,4-beta-xylanase [Paenibacillus sp. RC67]